MDIIKRFEVEDGILAISFDFTYPDGTPNPRLKECSATVDLAASDDTAGSPPSSPPVWLNTVNVALTGETNFDFRDSGTDAFGTISLQSFSGGNATGGVWLNVFYGPSGIRHFEGIATTFDWSLTTARS